jgi:hypothetical protein
LLKRALKLKKCGAVGQHTHCKGVKKFVDIVRHSSTK